MTTSSAVGMRLGQLLAVAARRQDVLVADDHERRHLDARPSRSAIVLVGGEDRVAPGGEGVRRATERERPEPADRRHQATERAWSDHPACGLLASSCRSRVRAAASPQLAEQLPRHGWLRHDVHASVSERTRSGYVTRDDLADRPAHRRADDVGGLDRRRGRARRWRRRPSARACRSPCGLSLRPAPRLSRAIVAVAHGAARRCRSQPCLSAPRPWISSTGGAAGRPVTR